MRRNDRHDAAWLALFVAAFGFIVAPLLHGLEHEHGHRHGPVEAPSAPHGQGSLEHQSLGFITPAVVVEPTFFLVELDTLAEPTVRPVWLAQVFSPAQPQGP